MRKIVCALLLITSFNILAKANQWEGVPLVNFNLQDQNGKSLSNKDFKGSWLVLYFYPKDKTPGCTVEAQNFTDDFAKYKALNTKILGVSYDDVDSHKEFADLYNLPFSLLADVDAELSSAMGVDRILPWPHASRQTFLVNPEGTIVHHFKKVKPNDHSKELLTLLKQLQTKGG